MRKMVAMAGLALLAGGCADATGTERTSVLGAWESEAFAPAQVEMTLSELARTVSGAGRWVQPDSAVAFLVSGSHVEDRVSLVFQIEDAADLSFQGEFVEEDVMEGTLVGGPYRGAPIRFVRVDDEE